MVVCTSNPVFEITVYETLADGANSPGFYFSKLNTTAFEKSLDFLPKWRLILNSLSKQLSVHLGLRYKIFENFK